MHAVAVAVGLVLAWAGGAGHVLAEREPQVYHVDDRAGDDRRDGTTPGLAWRSLERVNRAQLAPGDRVLFRRGGTWRGQLIPQSGAEGSPVTYGAYGEGPLPRLLGSASRNRPEDWEPAGPGLWRTTPIHYSSLGASRPLPSSSWRLYTEGPARATRPADALRILCETPGSARHHIQLSAHGLAITAGHHYGLSMRVRLTGQLAKPFDVSLMRAEPPWTEFAAPVAVRPDSGWSDLSLALHAREDSAAARVTLFLGDALAPGSGLEIAEATFGEVQPDREVPLDVDVGNIILDGGASVGFKKWTVDDLQDELDFVYDPAAQGVVMRSRRNPAAAHREVELALRRHIIDETGRSFVTYEDLALLNGAAHGIGGGSTRGITVRRCHISYIGGGHQNPQQGRVRYGNGVESWEGARDCLVEDCRLWEIYDAALTNQGSNTNVQEHIVYRRNVIWNSEYSFEYWNRGEDSVTRGIRFEHNTCVDAGGGWGHRQRSDPNGRHLMFFHNSAQTSDFVVEGNIFAGATDSLLRCYSPDRVAAMTMDGNCWFQPAGTGIVWGKQAIAPPDMAAFLNGLGYDRHSLFADPGFVNAPARDYRPKPDSPAAGLGAFAKSKIAQE